MNCKIYKINFHNPKILQRDTPNYLSGNAEMHLQYTACDPFTLKKNI